MFLHIDKAEYLNDYRLRLFFNDGAIKKVDLEDELEGEVFEPLRDKEFFRNSFISNNTIEWDNGADFDPEFLYQKALP